MALSRIVSIAAQLAVVVVLIALSGTSSQAAEDAPRAPDNQHKEECRFIVHNETIDKDGCVATLPLISCAGNCNSDATPKIFYSRAEADETLDHFTNKCECCGVTQTFYKAKNISLYCSHNTSSVTHTQVVPIPRGCTCSDCFFQHN